jgi:uncharacterized membrane protein required for colicin V production
MHGILNTPHLLAAASLDTKGLEISSFTVGWFDALVIVMLVLGLLRGRSRGMSAELMDLILWVLIILVGGFGHAALGKVISGVTGLSLLTSYIAAYLGIACFLGVTFMMLKHGVGEKLIGSDVFGNLEYYMGMCSGMFRFFCMLMMFMAVLNARLYTGEELKAQVKYQEKELGSVYFPTVAMLQKNVFQESFVGKLAKDNVPMLLITPMQPSAPKEGIGRRREKEVNDALGIK